MMNESLLKGAGARVVHHWHPNDLKGLDMQGIELGDRLERYLDLPSAPMKLTAGNMANMDTPGDKTQGFDFF